MGQMLKQMNVISFDKTGNTVIIVNIYEILVMCHVLFYFLSFISHKAL